MRDIPYSDRSDLQKIQTQWNKIGGLLSRGKDWSAAIIRAATAAEIAANLAIRKRFEPSGFTSDFVDSLLHWANGIDGKFKRLLIPSETEDVRKVQLKTFHTLAAKINNKRNEIIHRGFMADKPEAIEIIDIARQVIVGLVLPHEPTFKLIEKKPFAE